MPENLAQSQSRIVQKACTHPKISRWPDPAMPFSPLRADRKSLLDSKFGTRYSDEIQAHQAELA